MRSTPPVSHDPILERRAKVSNLVSLAIRAGSLLYLGAMALFFYALATRFTPASTSIMTACLIGGSVLLAPAMVFKYAVKAADRADREGDW